MLITRAVNLEIQNVPKRSN